MNQDIILKAENLYYSYDILIFLENIEITICNNLFLLT